VDDFSQQVGSKYEQEWNSIGGWAACQVCYELVEANKRNDLARRTLQAHPDVPKSGEVRKQAYRAVRRLHDEFFVMRSGPPEKITTRDENDGIITWNVD